MSPASQGQRTAGAWRPCKQVVIDFSGAAWFEGWLEDPVAYHEAAKAIARVLEELRPTGSTTLPQSVLDGLQTQGFDTIGERVAKDRLLLLTDVTGDERGKRLRKALGTLAAKLRKENLR
jgi:hypothetical protein